MRLSISIQGQDMDTSTHLGQGQGQPRGTLYLLQPIRRHGAGLVERVINVYLSIYTHIYIYTHVYIHICIYIYLQCMHIYLLQPLRRHGAGLVKRICGLVVDVYIYAYIHSYIYLHLSRYRIWIHHIHLHIHWHLFQSLRRHGAGLVQRVIKKQMSIYVHPGIGYGYIKDIFVCILYLLQHLRRRGIYVYIDVNINR